MFIKEITNQHRRDFSAILQCEGCKTEETLKAGYDDEYYHSEVLPNRKCPNCKETTNTLDNGIRTRPKNNDSIEL